MTGHGHVAVKVGCGVLFCITAYCQCQTITAVSIFVNFTANINHV